MLDVLGIAAALLCSAAPTTLDGPGVSVTLDLDGYEKQLGSQQLGKTYYRLAQYTGRGIVVSVLLDDVPASATLENLQAHVLKGRTPAPEVTAVSTPPGFYFSYREKVAELSGAVQWQMYFHSLTGRKWIELHFSKTGKEGLDEAAAKQAALALLSSMRIQATPLPTITAAQLDPGVAASAERALATEIGEPVAHARRESGETAAMARKRVNAWIRFNMMRAIDAKAAGDANAAAFHFFMALHTLQDSALLEANDDNGDPAVLLKGKKPGHDRPASSVWRDRMAEDLRTMFDREVVPAGDLLHMYGLDTEAGPNDKPGQLPRPFASPAGSAPAAPAAATSGSSRVGSE